MQKFIILLSVACLLNVLGIANFMAGNQLPAYAMVVAGLAVLFTAVILHTKGAAAKDREKK